SPGTARRSAPRSRAAVRAPARAPRAARAAPVRDAWSPDQLRHCLKRATTRTVGGDTAAGVLRIPDRQPGLDDHGTRPVGGGHPRMAMHVAHHVDVGIGNRAALADDRAGNAVLVLTGSNVRDGTELDDRRGRTDGDLALDAQRARCRRAQTVALDRSGARLRAGGERIDAAGRVGEPLRIDALRERSDDPRDALLAEVVPDDQGIA